MPFGVIQFKTDNCIFALQAKNFLKAYANHINSGE